MLFKLIDYIVCNILS